MILGQVQTNHFQDKFIFAQRSWGPTSLQELQGKKVPTCTCVRCVRIYLVACCQVDVKDAAYGEARSCRGSHYGSG
jgi:hypothetical protein